VKSIVELVSALGIRSVAEGVESADVATALAAMGCDAAQGWYFSKPLNAVSATAWLAERAGPAVELPPREAIAPATAGKPATSTATPPTGWLARPGA
jgi:predicted signal transduction protein with EAL and GGDEF domain